MKKEALFILLFWSSAMYAQQDRIQDVLNGKRIQVDRLSISQSERTSLLVSSFEKGGCTFNSAATKATNLSVSRIYYTYTQNKTHKNYDQHSLDRKRFLQLKKYCPNLLNDPSVEWVIVEQTGHKNATAGKKFFHGFILCHRPVNTQENRENELQLLDSILKNPAILENLSFDQDPVLLENATLKEQMDEENVEKTSTSEDVSQAFNTKSTRAFFRSGSYELYNHFKKTLRNSPGQSINRSDNWVNIRMVVDEKGRIDTLIFRRDLLGGVIDRIENSFRKMPVWNPKFINGKAVKDTVNLELRVSIHNETNGMYLIDGNKPEFSSLEVTMSEMSDDPRQRAALINAATSAVFQGLDATNGNGKLAVVMDVTGSMIPHIAGMLVWIRIHSAEEPFTSYTFFNDGDKKSPNMKPIGNAGGVYSTGAIDGLDFFVRDVMTKGYGGDEISENDLEAVLQAIKMDSRAHEILLIADNYSEVRDLSLLGQVSLPVNVLLCAVESTIRPDYLLIAKETGGKIILNGEMFSLSDMKTGDDIKLNNIRYEYNGQTFLIKEKNPKTKP